MINDKETTVHIAKYTTYFSFKCDESGVVAPGIFISKFINNKLSEFEYDTDSNKFKPKNRFLVFNKGMGVFSFPINLLTSFTQFVVGKNGNYKIHSRDPNEFDDIEINMKDGFKDKERQTGVIGFLSDPLKSFKALKLQTGIGKTYCAIRTICNIKKKTLIILPNFLVSQWVSELRDKTDIELDEIYIIKGAESICSIIDDPSIISKTKIFIASSKTLIQYVNKDFDSYKDIISFKEFIKLIRIGLKITDECHMLFHSNTIIDLHCNVADNIYLSATYTRSNQSSNRIFNAVFPEHLKYDDRKYDRYVKITECLYSLGYIHPMAAKTKRGYNQIKYEKWLLKDPNRNKTLYERVFEPLVRMRYIDLKNKDEKLVIFITMKITGYKLCNFLKSKFPYFKIGVFFNETPESVLKNTDIIITTIGSLGVGKDVKGLRTVILFVSFVSEGLCYQVLGRLRKLPNDVPPEFVFMQNVGIPEHNHHLQMRRVLYKTLCKTYETLRLN